MDTHYLRAGSGPPLLLLHGLGGSWRWWRPNLEPLAQGYQVYALDLPGHGLSGPPPRHDLSFSRHLLLAFLKGKGLEKVNLVGHSLGGLLSLDFALHYPERVLGLVLVDSPGLGREIHWILRLLTLPLLGEVLSRPSRPGLAAFLKLLFYDPSFVTPEMVEESLKERQRLGVRGTVLGTLRAGVGLGGQRLWPPVLETLPSLQPPTLILWGEQDRLIPVAHAHRAHGLIPGSQLQIFPRCGHCPQIEKAAEFNALVAAFLSRSSLSR